MVLSALSNLYKHTRTSYQRLANHLQRTEYFSARNQRIINNVVSVEKDLINNHTAFKIGESAHITNVAIPLRGKKEYIHTLQTGDGNKDDLVLVHGYFVGLMSFFKMLGPLSKHYKVWSIDLVGMGASSRPDFDLKTTDDTIDYFVESIEEWRKAVGLESFYMSGHSFGGYMVTWYALKYPQRVKKMMLLSPAGVSRSEKFYMNEQMLNQYSWWRRQLLKFFFWRWNKGLTPHSILNFFWFWRDRFIRAYVSRTHSKGKELELAYYYMRDLIKLPDSTHRSLHLILGFPRASGIKPLEDQLSNLKSPLDIYYGEYDWIDTAGAFRASKKGDFKGKIHIIPNAGHNMNFDNPEHVANLMIRNKYT